jgi:TnpA family transposase
MVNVGVRDSTCVLDGLLYHKSDLRIEEHYTDTAGLTDHVFALMYMLGFRFVPLIRDLGDTKLYIPGAVGEYPGLKTMIGGTLNIKHVRTHWNDILRLASSIKHGTVTASLMLRKLGSYPRQKRLGDRITRAGAHRTDAVHPELAAKRRTSPARTCGIEQGRGAQRLGQGGLHPPTR